MKRVFVGGIILLVYGSATAQFSSMWFDPDFSVQIHDLNIPNNLDFDVTGLGARALGMGGAFLAIADDPTAVWWNPAGLTQLSQPEVYFVGNVVFRSREYDTPAFSGTEILSEIDPHGYLGSGSFVFPLLVRSMRVVPGIAYQRLSDMNQRVNNSRYIYGGGLFEDEQNTNGGLSSFSPSVALQFTSNISAGVTFNILSGDAEYKYTTRDAYTDDLQYQFQDKESYSGNSVHVGTLMKLTDFLSLGFTITPSWNLSYRVTNKSSWYASYSDTEDTTIATPADSLADGKIEVPLFYGFGAALQPLKGLTLGIDYQVKPWSKAKRNVSGNRTEAGFEDTHLLRIGAEYVLNSGLGKIPVRFGYHSLPTPYRDGIDIFGESYEGAQIKGDVVAIGTGLMRGRFIFDVAYEYGYVKDEYWWDYYNDRKMHSERRLNRIIFALGYKLKD